MSCALRSGSVERDGVGTGRASGAQIWRVGQVYREKFWELGHPSFQEEREGGSTERTRCLLLLPSFFSTVDTGETGC